MIDTHAHLDFPEFGEDLEAVLARASASGVKNIVTIGIDGESNRKAVALAGQFPQVYAAVGCHPHEADHWSEEFLNDLEKLARHPKVVAIGETGLDFYRNRATPENQMRAFDAQIDLAIRLKKPLVIHIRNAFERAFTHLVERAEGKTTVVLHCFQEGEEGARRAVNAGFFLSFNGTLTYKSSALPEVAKALPLESILLETDCPFLPPVPYRGKRNEPAYLSLVLEKLKTVRPARTRAEIDAQIEKNSRAVFGFDSSGL